MSQENQNRREAPILWTQEVLVISNLPLMKKMKLMNLALRIIATGGCKSDIVTKWTAVGFTADDFLEP